MHDHNDSGAPMMWMMLICCLVPVVLAFIFGRSTGNVSIWWGLAAMGAFALIVLMARRKN